MPTLYPVGGEGDSIEVADKDVAAKLRSGLYKPQTQPTESGGEHVRLVGPDGTFYSAPLAHVPDYIEKNGFRVAQGADSFEHDNPIMGKALAGIGGLGNAALFGAVTPAIDAVTGGDWGRATAEQHGGWRYGTEIPASLILALAGGMGGVKSASSVAELEALARSRQTMQTIGAVGTLAKADEAASALKGIVTTGALAKTKAALSAGWGAAKAIAPYTPTGKVAQLTSQAQESLASMVTKEIVNPGQMGVLTSMLANMGKVGAAFAGPGAAEGALWGISQAVNEKALGDPHEWGELLFTDMAHQALMGAAFAGAAGGLKGFVGAGIRRGEKGIIGRLSGEVQPDGSFGKAAVDEMRSQTLKLAKITDKQLSNMESAVGSTEFHDVLHSPDLIPEGVKPGVEGGSLFTTKSGNELNDLSSFAERVKAGMEYHGAAIGDLTREAGDGVAESKATSLKQLLAARIEEAKGKIVASGADLSTPEGKALYAKTGPDVNMQDIADKLREIRTGENVTSDLAPRMTPRFKALGDEAARFDRDAPISAKDLNIEMKQVGGAFRTNDLTPDDAKSARRALYGIFQRAQMENAATKLGADGQPLLSAEQIAQWKMHNQAYSALRGLNEAIEGVKGDQGAASGIMNMMKRMYSKATWAMSFRGTFALRSMFQSALAGRMPIYGAAALMTTPVGAIAGAAGAAAAGGLLPSLMPSAQRIAEIAYKGARYKQWGKALETLDGHAATLVSQWVRDPGKLARGAAITGEQLLKQFGGSTDASEGARNLQRRLAVLTRSPEALAEGGQQFTAHLQKAAPTAALACANAYGRACMINHTILDQLNDARKTSTFQPALSSKLPYHKEAISSVGKQLAASVMPKETLQSILAGTASDKQIQIFKTVHPQMYMAMLKHLSIAVQQMEVPLNGKQIAILAKLGFRDSTSFGGPGGPLAGQAPQPSMASRQMRVGQAAYTQQGSQDAGPAMSRFQSLGKTLASGGSDLNHSPVQQLKK